MDAFELIVPVTAFVDMGASAERAHYHITPTRLGDEVTAMLVVIEMVDKGNMIREIRELKCSSASHIVQGITIYLYLKPTGIFQNSPDFFSLDFNILRDYWCNR